MIYGSVCSGIEAASAAWHPLGWRPAFFAEVADFPSAVLAHHFGSNMPGEPLARNGVPNHGDFTSIPAGAGAIDLLVGGTPCQSFSIAGLRAGLDDERGNLALEFCKLARRLGPRWVVWENVPGVLSLDRGRAFASILGGLAECGYGLAYRVLDAQFVRVDGFGRAVPQRRRRVFVVGYLGDWRRAAAVLFERQSLSGHPAPRRQAGEGAAGSLKASSGRRGCDDAECGSLVAGTLNAGGKAAGSATTQDAENGLLVAHTLNAGGQGCIDAETETMVVHALRADGFDAGEDGTGRGTPLVPVHGVAFAENTRNELRLVDGDGGIAPSLQTQGGKAGRGYPAIAYRTTGNDGVYEAGDVAPCLATGTDPNHTTLLTPDAKWASEGASKSSWVVRRLTPVECERLQGFPDGYTAVPYRGKPAADGPRYKALGNSMAVNVMRWIGRRIEIVDAMA